LLQTGELGGAVAALTGDQRVAAVLGSDDERLEDAVLADRLGELVQRLLVEAATRVAALGNLDLAQRDEPQLRCRAVLGRAHDPPWGRGFRLPLWVRARPVAEPSRAAKAALSRARRARETAAGGLTGGVRP